MISKKYPISTKEEIQQIVLEHTEYAECLFARGYLLTDDLSIDTNVYPFFGKWSITKVSGKLLLTHPKEKVYTYETPEYALLLIGHAYNPFNGKYNEEELLRDCCKENFSFDNFLKTVNEWTGAFVVAAIDTEGIRVLTDATSMKMCNFCLHNGHVFFSSHVQLLADLFDYKMTKYAAKLRRTKMYNTGLRWMPGLTTPYREISRLGPNLYAEVKQEKVAIQRFYPTKPHCEINDPKSYKQMVEEISEILRSNMDLCTKKWSRPAISLTGGMDSGAAFAATKGFTDKFTVFSFDCKSAERRDSEAAANICEKVGVPHKQYHIPENEELIEHYADLRKIVNHNSAYVKNLAEEEIRKILYLRKKHDFDVEAKSDVAEIGRVFYERKYGMPMPTTLNERHLSVMQTRFFFMPRLLRQTDRVYRSFLHSTGLETPIYNFEHSDIIYWEFRIGAAAAASTQSLGMLHELTFPYNNRILLEKFLAFPHDIRKKDYPQKQIMLNLMPEIVKQDFQVEDNYFQRRRILLEKCFFKYKTTFYRPKKG